LEEGKRSPATNEPPAALPNQATAISTNEPNSELSETNSPWLAPVTNSSLAVGTKSQIELARFQAALDLGRKQRAAQLPVDAEKQLLQLLDSSAPPEIKRPALLELALLALEQKQLSKAQQLFSKYAKVYATDPSLPEILYRQGLLYREMGAPVMALSKFYAVMSTSLTLKLDQFAYYQRLVLLAKIEIADTYYLQGSFEEASDYLARLLKTDDPALKKAIVHYKLIRSLSNLGRNFEVAAQSKLFLLAYSDSGDLAEVRFLYADSLRKLGRNREAMEQVLILLQSQQTFAEKNPENWRYWQQRTGNDIANQLYKEGDYLNALEIYLNLSKLDDTPAWKLPVTYQVGLTYERLLQPAKADEMYETILKAGREIDANANASLGQLIQMARWRKNTLAWVSNATASAHAFAPSAAAAGKEQAQ